MEDVSQARQILDMTPTLDIFIGNRIREAFLNGSPVVPLCRAEKASVAQIFPYLPIRMTEFAISIRHVLDYWPSETFDAILRARDEYDAGLIEMTQAKLCNHFILYAIPRKKPATNRRRYFASMQEIY